MEKPELIVMLTKNDYTVPNACEIFDACKDSEARLWGIKEEGLPLEKMKELFSAVKGQGKRGVLEVVSYSEEGGLHGAELAAACGCDILLGTMYYESIHSFCRHHRLQYMPFIGQVSGRPSVMEGSVEEIVAQAERVLAQGVCGLDLLSYRYTGDADELTRTLISRLQAPICMAGSIDSYEKLDSARRLAPTYYTIGSAFFDHKFGADFGEQIDRVCRYMN